MSKRYQMDLGNSNLTGRRIFQYAEGNESKIQLKEQNKAYV